MRGNGVIVNADGHGDFAGDGLVKSKNLLFRQWLIGDCRQEQRIGASPLRILCQTKDPIGPQRADPAISGTAPACDLACRITCILCSRLSQA